MTIRQFRFLLAGSVAIGALAPTIDLAYPELLSAGFRAAQEAHDAGLSNRRLLMVGGASAVFFVALGIALYGLYTFQPWAPWIALLSTALGLVLISLIGAWAQSGFAISGTYVASYLWGAVLIQAFFPPFSAHFKRRELRSQPPG